MKMVVQFTMHFISAIENRREFALLFQVPYLKKG